MIGLSLTKDSEITFGKPSDLDGKNLTELE